MIVKFLKYHPGIKNYTYSKITASFLLTFTLSIINFGCTTERIENHSQPSVDRTTSSNNAIKSLNVVVIPALSPTEQAQQLKSLSDYLGNKLGIKVDFQVAKDYNTAVELLVTGKVEMAYLGPLTYIKAKKLNPEIQPILAPIEKSTGRPWYTSIIIANSAKGIKTIQDLKAKQFGFVSKSSTSGYLVPIVHLKKSGIEPERDFAGVQYSGSHDKAEADLEAGIVDAIADSKPSYLKGQKSGKLLDKKYKIIWESEPIPLSPIVISKKLSPPLVTEIKEALINAPEGLADITGAESAGYTLVQDSDYEPIKQLQENLEAQSIQTKLK